MRRLADQNRIHSFMKALGERATRRISLYFTGGATAYHPARNAEASPLRYTVHPDDLLRITLAIDDAGEDLLAIFHSHTRSPAVPSAVLARRNGQIQGSSRAALAWSM